MKKITEEKIKVILEELMAINIPVKSYAGIQKIFAELPLIEEPKK